VKARDRKENVWGIDNDMEKTTASLIAYANWPQWCS